MPRDTFLAGVLLFQHRGGSTVVQVEDAGTMPAESSVQMSSFVNALFTLMGLRVMKSVLTVQAQYANVQV